MALKPAPEVIHLKTRWTDEPARLVWGSYSNGRPALEFVTMSGEPMARATVNLEEVMLPPGCTFVKSYSENEGMAEALEQAGIVEVLTKFQYSRVYIHLCRWTVVVPIG